MEFIATIRLVSDFDERRPALKRAVERGVSQRPLRLCKSGVSTSEPTNWGKEAVSRTDPTGN